MTPYLCPLYIYICPVYLTGSQEVAGEKGSIVRCRETVYEPQDRAGGLWFSS